MDNRRGGGGNPWKRSRGRGDGSNQSAASRDNGHGKGDGGTRIAGAQQQQQQAEDRFQKAKAQMQASAHKHMKNDYESSEEEEELESENILVSVLQSYSQLGGQSMDLGRTQRFLEDAFQSGAATCLICIASVKRTDPVWSCAECYCFFHLTCIQRWSKDSVAHQKMASEEQPRGKPLEEFKWACPKCRHEYPVSATPQRYRCFCGRMDDPVYHPWLVPHSCGETCNRPLQPTCGHDCLLLCHPGPCPPCPKMVKSSCYCGKQGPAPHRCSNKQWSCGQICSATLLCGLHPCPLTCHSSHCPPCPKTSMQSCVCGMQKQLRQCADPSWQCGVPCGKPLDCAGKHACSRVCHGGKCGPCPLSLSRACPCGKRSYTLACTTRDTPLCGDTCALPLDCGAHACSRPCHRDKCGPCLEVVKKHCRCGKNLKELPCQNKYVCETKCKNVKDCRRHPCNRKCCDGNCPPCEKLCDRTLPCGRHKCSSVCHRGPCYPCPLTVDVTCRCGAAVLTVPCGRQKKTKPPRCSLACALRADCHHPARQPHRCHYGDCPPCSLTCGKSLAACQHTCPVACHSAVWVTLEAHKPAGPWEKVAPVVQMRNIPCPPCKVPVAVTCFGGHETVDWPCHVAKPSSCQRACGRPLACGNHKCALPCHSAQQKECAQCEAECGMERPPGCAHPCRKPCHRGECAPCAQMLRLRCHCALNQLFVRCGEWTAADADKKVALQSCTNQCPKNYDCGHRCHTPCHPGPCPEPEACRKKVKQFCLCRRLRREFPCDVVRAGKASVPCDDECQRKREEERDAKAAEQERKREEEERRNKEEVEKFEKKFQGRKKHRERRHNEEEREVSLISKYWIYLVSLSGVLLAAYYLIFVQ